MEKRIMTLTGLTEAHLNELQGRVWRKIIMFFLPTKEYQRLWKIYKRLNEQRLQMIREGNI